MTLPEFSEIWTPFSTRLFQMGERNPALSVEIYCFFTLKKKYIIGHVDICHAYLVVTHQISEQKSFQEALTGIFPVPKKHHLGFINPNHKSDSRFLHNSIHFFSAFCLSNALKRLDSSWIYNQTLQFPHHHHQLTHLTSMRALNDNTKSYNNVFCWYFIGI